jgi:hypothetical protein
MKNSTTPSEITAVKQAIADLATILAEHDRWQSGVEADRRELAELEASVKAAVGSFDPRKEPARLEQFVRDQKKAELLRAFLGHRDYLGSPVLDKFPPAVRALLTATKEIGEYRAAEFTPDAEYVILRALSDDPAGAARHMIDLANRVLSRRFPGPSPDFGPGPLQGARLSLFTAAATPEPA